MTRQAAQPGPGMSLRNRELSPLDVAPDPNTHEQARDQGQNEEGAQAVGDRARAPHERDGEQRDASVPEDADPRDPGVEHDIDPSRDQQRVDYEPAADLRSHADVAPRSGVPSHRGTNDPTTKSTTVAQPLWSSMVPESGSPWRWRANQATDSTINRAAVAG